MEKTYILHLNDSEYIVLRLKPGVAPQASYVDDWEQESKKVKVTRSK